MYDSETISETLFMPRQWVSEIADVSTCASSGYIWLGYRDLNSPVARPSKRHGSLQLKRKEVPKRAHRQGKSMHSTTVQML